MGKFFNGRVKKDRSTLIKYGTIAGGILLIFILFIIIAAKNSKHNNAVLELKESIDIEINSELPEKMDFFTKFENYDESLISIEWNGLDTSKVGEYTVTIRAEKGSEDVTVNVIDSTAPVLKLKDVTIDVGDTYEIEQFVESCTDNSNETCIYEYYKESIDQQGNPIDYSNFTEENTYLIKIIAKDESGNSTPVQDARLIIGSGVAKDASACTYGDLSVSNVRVDYPMAVIVGDQNNQCALSKDLWNSSSVQSPVNKLYQTDYNNLKIELKDILTKKNYPSARIVAYPHYIAILNDDLQGLVGYAIYVKVYIVTSDYTGQIDSDENLILAYYLNSDLSRDYEINKYNLD